MLATVCCGPNLIFGKRLAELAMTDVRNLRL
jgi:hypothetical protein